MGAHEHTRTFIDTRLILTRADSRSSFTVSGTVGILARDY
jgi:hypothetical protein